MFWVEYKLTEQFTFGGEVHAVVEALRPLVSDVGHDLLDLGVDRHALNVDVCEPEHSHGRRVVASTALETDEAGLNNVDSSNAVAASDIVQGLEDLERAGHGLTTLNLELDRLSSVEGDGELGGGVGGLEGV